MTSRKKLVLNIGTLLLTININNKTFQRIKYELILSTASTNTVKVEPIV